MWRSEREAEQRDEFDLPPKPRSLSELQEERARQSSIFEELERKISPQ